METIFDWVSVLLFGVIALTFLQRSLKRPDFSDSILAYMPASLGCVMGNWLGNEAYVLGSCIVLGLTVIYTLVIIRPFR